MNLIPSKAGAYIIAVLSLIAPFLAVLRAFNVTLTEDQIAAVTGLAGAVVVGIQRFTGSEKQP